MLLDHLQALALTTVALVVVVNPIGVSPLYLAMTDGDAPEHRRRTARTAALTAAGLLAGAAVVGEFLLHFLSISLPSFRIAGGALLFVIGFDMLQLRQTRLKTTDEEVAHGTDKPEVGIVPLGCPMLAGPGAIATVIAMRGHSDLSFRFALLLAAIAVTALICWLTLRLVLRTAQRLSPSALGVINRLQGLLLAALAVEMAVRGLKETFPALQ